MIIPSFIHCGLLGQALQLLQRYVISVKTVLQALKAGETGDEDIIRLAAEDAELARAKERLTLKHRNSSKWARRALKRGMNVMDEGTKAAVAEQLRLGEELRRKVSSVSLFLA